LNVEEALKATVDLLLGENSLPVKARCKDYISDEEVAALYNAIDILTEEYRHKDCVPKELAACFVDIWGCFSFREGFYSEEESIRLEDIGIALQEKATILFDAAPPAALKA
jgi:hypothetical protein